MVGLLTVEFHVPGSHSLKDKRMVLRRVKDRIKKFNVAVSEVEHQDLWQRAGLAVVTVEHRSSACGPRAGGGGGRDRAGRAWSHHSNGSRVPHVT